MLREALRDWLLTTDGMTLFEESESELVFYVAPYCEEMEPTYEDSLDELERWGWTFNPYGSGHLAIW